MGADRFSWLHRPKTGKTVLAAFGFLLLAIFGAAAQENAWSFEDNPHPTYEEKTSQESSLTNFFIGTDSLPTYCEKVVSANYKVYQQRYPDFQKSGDPETNFANWETHILTPTERIFSYCVIYSWTIKMEPLLDPPPDADFYFCGLYSRPPASERERKTAEVIDRIIVFAKTGSMSASIFFLVTNDRLDFFDLNPDVEYYFSKLVEQYLVLDTNLGDVVNLEPLISEERRAFVDRAAKNSDLQAVFDTTEPCAPRAAN